MKHPRLDIIYNRIKSYKYLTGTYCMTKFYFLYLKLEFTFSINKTIQKLKNCKYCLTKN